MLRRAIERPRPEFGPAVTGSKCIRPQMRTEAIGPVFRECNPQFSSGPSRLVPLPNAARVPEIQQQRQQLNGPFRLMIRILILPCAHRAVNATSAKSSSRLCPAGNQAEKAIDGKCRRGALPSGRNEP